MRVPPITMASDRLILLGQWHKLMLLQFPETVGLVPAFEPLLGALQASAQAVQVAERALLEPRIQSAVAESLAEAQLRQLQAQARIEDGGKEGALIQALFAGGLTAAVQPVGPRQLDALDAVLRQAKARQLEAHATLGPRLSALAEVRERLAAALAARQTAQEALTAARVADRVAREGFVAAYSRDAGLLRALFPTDKAKAELFFDRWESSPAATAEADTTTSEPGGPGPG